MFAYFCVVLVKCSKFHLTQPQSEDLFYLNNYGQETKKPKSSCIRGGFKDELLGRTERAADQVGSRGRREGEQPTKPGETNQETKKLTWLLTHI